MSRNAIRCGGQTPIDSVDHRWWCDSALHTDDGCVGVIWRIRITERAGVVSTDLDVESAATQLQVGQ